MDYLIVTLAAFLTSGLTLFSGFGLGTLLLPAFAIFFPTNIAVGLTAVVHLLNNLFKLAILGKHAKMKIVAQFGLPAIGAAFLGAYALVWFSHLSPIMTYSIGGKEFTVTPLRLVIAWLILLFAVVELTPKFAKVSFDKKYLPVGGILSGFFGGLSGHQGALRSAFLIKCNLSKESFIATGVVIACLVDVSRLFIYSSRFSRALVSKNATLLLTAILAAFLGVFVGNRLLQKVTMRHIQILVAILLFGVAVGLGSGFI